ncbi:MAG: RluA family pseudouridine synthase [Acidobacteriota bacterium]
MPKPERKRRRFQRDMSAAVEEHRFVVGAPEEGLRVDAFLAAKLKWRSRARLRRLVEEGCVELFESEGGAVDVRRVRPSLRLRRLQEVVLRLDATSRLAPASAEIPIQILYEDADLLALNKGPGVSIYPNQRHRSGSLIERLHRQVRESRELRRLGEVDVDWMPTPCHRLDRDTSGLVVLAKNPRARASLGLQFEERTLSKIYVAAVAGLADEHGTIDAPLGPAVGSTVELRMATRPDGQPALTKWRCLARGEDSSLLELRPRTGRQHQLRAHLESIGHPILGDRLYLGGNDVFLRSLDGGLTEADVDRLRAPRQALHALRLCFTHPRTGKEIELTAPVWPDIVELLGLELRQQTPIEQDRSS